MRGRSIKLYIMGEKYKNIKTAELSNWTGKAYLGQRKHINVLQNFEELCAPGVYFLLSEIEDSYQKRLYIGEADEINSRLNSHFKNKDWWTNFVCFISKDSNLTKAHVRYLERKLFEIASENKTILELENLNTPTGSKLPISDCDDMDEFSENVLFILKNLGVIDFTKTNLIENKEVRKEDIFYMNIPAEKGKSSEQAKLVIRNGSYILLKDSFIRKKNTQSFSVHNYIKLRNHLEKENYFEELEDQNYIKLIKDIEFSSPSAAGAVARNSSVNGRTEWKTVDGVTLDNYENRN